MKRQAQGTARKPTSAKSELSLHGSAAQKLGPGHSSAASSAALFLGLLWGAGLGTTASQGLWPEPSLDHLEDASR